MWQFLLCIGTRRHAIVHVDSCENGLMLPYQASLFAIHQRLLETNVLTIADHVLMACYPSRVFTHSAILLATFNCTEIDDATKGKGLNGPAMYKIAAYGLAAYDRLLLLDFDTYVHGDISSVFKLPAPAMVRWESKVAAPVQPSSGVQLIQPQTDLYFAALKWLRKLPKSTARQRAKLLMEMRTPWGSFNNRSEAIPPNPVPVMAADSDQHFLFTLFNVLEDTRFGPLHELPYEFNVRGLALSKRTWSAAYAASTRYRDVRIVHLNRDKPWEGAQCGPFHRGFWEAAGRAVAMEAQSGRIPNGLQGYVRDGAAHETTVPCRRGAKTDGVYVATQRLELLPHT